MCTILPVTVIFESIFIGLLTKGTILSKKIWGEAGGIIEEILYNIKTVLLLQTLIMKSKNSMQKLKKYGKLI